jgi:hypothetical protein
VSPDETVSEPQGEPAAGVLSESAPAPAVAAVLSDTGYRPRKSRPVLGPALILLGAMLWAYVVMGTFTTSWLSGSAPLREGFAVMGVVFVTVCAWIFALRRSRPDPARAARGPVARSAAIGLAALGLWVLCVLLAILLGIAIPAPGFIEAVLLIVAGVAAFVGHRWTAPPGPPPPLSPGRRAATAAMWIGIAIVTLSACVEMAGEG